MKLVLASLLAAALVATPLRAADRLMVGLYLAEKHPTNPQAAPKLASRLHQVFGYPFYKLLKADSVKLSDHDRWVISRKDFYLRLRPGLRHGTAPQNVGYGIYKDGYLIADGNYTVSEDTPLFITGPDFRGGRLIFVIEAK